MGRSLCVEHQYLVVVVVVVVVVAAAAAAVCGWVLGLAMAAATPRVLASLPPLRARGAAGAQQLPHGCSSNGRRAIEWKKKYAR